MEKRELSEREKRRKKRIKSQILAYLTLAVFVVLILTGGYFGVKAISRYLSEYNSKVEQALAEAENQSQSMENEEVQSQPESEVMTEPESSQEDNPLDELIQALLSDMSLEEKIAGMFMITPESITGVSKAVQAKEGTKEALLKNPVGGFIYSEKNFQSSQQFQEMLANTRSYSKFPIFLAVSRDSSDKESYGISAGAKNTDLSDTQSVSEAYKAIGKGLAELGVTMNLAPVADIVSEEGNAVLQGRTFGSDASSAAPLVTAAVEALQTEKVSAVLQKFPGEGSADTQGVIAKSLEELKNSDFITYQLAIENGVDAIMISNCSADTLTGDTTPCSLSSVVITDILREMLGYDGLVLTDDLSDSKITQNYTSEQAAVAAIQAGADMLVTPQSYEEAYEGVLQAVAEGTITQERIEESLYRIYRVKYKDTLS